MTNEQVETPKQLAVRVGISEYQVRELIRTGQLGHVRIGDRKFIPRGAWPRYLEANMKGGTPWQDETRGQDSSGTDTVPPIISVGPKMDAAMSAARTQAISKRLKQSSQSGLLSDRNQPAQVVRLKR